MAPFAFHCAKALKYSVRYFAYTYVIQRGMQMRIFEELYTVRIDQYRPADILRILVESAKHPPCGFITYAFGQWYISAY